ncbi:MULTISPECIES: MATE family efflux transporter [unclassified Romboutsia]|uniref:MATE family efflux transporter n=1 Tax=unclassified Romboutsia TaxID=2626894 RepID=UPI000820AC69|nr:MULTISPECIES: MATE family efflux transporter [unclassified Romboutsia]SCI26849.1 Multidrug export protein mepA [uncultured Clostridium sp.]
MKNSQQILGTEPIGKLLLKYSVPAIIGMMVNALYNVVDRMFIGNIPNVGPMAITGLGVTMPIMTIMLAFGMLVGVGSATNISIKMGQGKRDEAEGIIGNAITLSVTIGIILTVIGTVFSDKILSAFGASDSTLYYAKSYMSVILLGAVFQILAMAFNNMIRGDGNPKLSAIIMTVGCVTNIVLDAVLIFGFNMGIQGAAIATVTSQGVTAIWGLLYYLKGKSNLKFRKSSLKLNSNIVKMIFAIGSAPFAMQLAASLVQVLSNNSLRSYGGDLAIGAMATISSITMIFLMPSFGLVQGMQPIVGFNYGAKNYDRAVKTFKITLLASTCMFVVGSLLIQFAPQVLVGMFNRDAELMDITVNGLRKYAFALPIVGLSVVGTNYIQSTGKAKVAMVLSLLRQVILLIPMILILPNIFDLNGVWFAQPTADIIASVITGVVILREIRSYKIKEVYSEDIQAV